MQEEQQIVGAVGKRFPPARHRGRILADVAGAAGGGAVHADAFFVGAMPLAPAVAFAGFDVHAIMIAGDVGERL